MSYVPGLKCPYSSRNSSINISPDETFSRSFVASVATVGIEVRILSYSSLVNTSFECNDFKNELAIKECLATLEK